MANYINWCKTNQPSQSGSVLMMQGNPASNHEVTATAVASGAAPEGVNYAFVWSDVATTVEANTLRNPKTGQDDSGSFTLAIPANAILEIPNVIGSITTITMTDI